MNIPEIALPATLEVLRRARWYCARGWVRGVSSVDASGRSFHGQQKGAVAWSLDGAINKAGRGEIVGEYARRALRKATGSLDLPQWNDWPLRTQREVLAALDKAIGLLGGTAPRRGGWVVTDRRGAA